MPSIRRLLGRGKKDKAAEKATPKETSLSLDTDSLYSTDGAVGMKVLAEGENDQLDIVFVHGLTGDRETTWTHKNKNFWPKELAADIEIARIMTFGYDADPVKLWGMAGGNTIRNHGKNLAFAISDRRRKCRERPIIFIAHSLGGLVCEQALLSCTEGADSNLEKVFQSTRGIIFMGTPHAGADLATYGFQLAKLLNVVRGTNAALLDPLRQKSEVLTTVQQRFQQSVARPEVLMKIHCFFEEKPVVGVGKIVDEHSAALSQYPNHSIAANHMDMTKFSGRTDDGYQKVLGRLESIIEWSDALLVTERNTEPSNDSGQDLRQSEARQLTSDAVSNSGSGAAFGIGQQNVQGGFHIYKSHSPISTDKRLHVLRTSEYERYKDRNPEHVEGTCNWFLGHPNYTNWRDNTGPSLLWVSADPGCGKSVLAKFLVDSMLRTNSSRTTCYFFFKDDNEDQKTAKKALCAILHQIFVQKPNLLPHAYQSFDQNGEDSVIKNLDVLWNILLDTSADSEAGEIVCILDALDECKRSELSELLPKICRYYDKRSQSTTLKFLVTSRPLQHIEDKFFDLSQKFPSIRLAGEEESNQVRTEIDLVINYRLQQLQRKRNLGVETVSLIQKELTKVEHRTYLWFTLVFELLETGVTSTQKEEREKLFNNIPPTVEAAYTAILNQSTDEQASWKLLQIVCAATPPLTTSEMSVAMQIRESDTTCAGLELNTPAANKQWIRNLCGLFVNVIDDRVYLLHQTAKEFLMLVAETSSLQRTTMETFHGNWQNSISVSASNFVLAQSCMWFVRLEEFYTRISMVNEEDSWEEQKKKMDMITSEFSFLEYSSMNWATHLRAVTIPQAICLTALSLELCNVPLEQYRTWMEIYLIVTYSEVPVKVFSLWIASSLGLAETVAQLLAAPGIDVNQADEGGETALLVAAMTGHEAVVRQLLAAPGIDVNQANKDGETALFWAARLGDEGIVAQLLAAPGIDVNQANSEGETALLVAVIAGYEAVVAQLLVSLGIDVNQADNEGKTALFWAARSGHEGIVAQLLAAPGINVNQADKGGETALRGAVIRRHEAVVTQLLAAPGINVNQANKVGETALSWAVTMGHEAIVKQLNAFIS